jgi:HEPN domain-containing protein
MSRSRLSKSPTVPVRTVSRSQAVHYIRKAEQHLAGALEALSAERWDTTVLLAIHAAMAAADAVYVASAGAPIH